MDPRPTYSPADPGTGSSVPRWPALALGLAVLLTIAAATGVFGLLVGLLLALLPVPLYVGLALWLDRFEPEPGPLLLRAFLWGAVAASFISLILNAAVSALTQSDLINAVAAAPVIEELAKAAVLFALFEAERHEFDNVTDGIVYATMVGLGFAMMENVLYYGQAVAEGGLSFVLLMRGAVFPYAHPLFTAMVGIGLGIAREMHGRRGSWVAPFGGLLLAIGLHSLWNFAAGLEDGLFWKFYAGLMVPLFLMVLLIAWNSLQREAGVIRQHLTPLCESGVLPRDELHCLCSVRRRLIASIRSAREHGLEHWRHRHRFHRATSELAFHRWRAARGITAGELGAIRETYYLQEIRGYLRAAERRGSAGGEQL